jgi:hypothetical protein
LDFLEVDAFVKIEVVQLVLVVLEEMEVPPGTCVAEGVHAYYLLANSQAFLA